MTQIRKAPHTPPRSEVFFEFQSTSHGILQIKILAHSIEPSQEQLDQFSHQLLELVASHHVIIADISDAHHPKKGLISWATQLQEEVKDSLQAVAIYVHSPLSRIIGNLFTGVLKMPFPIKVFDTFEAAKSWAQARAHEANKSAKPNSL